MEEGFPPVMPGETVAYCVPIGMSCTTDTTDFRGGVWGWSQAVTEPGAAVTVGPAMQIRWRDSDLDILETHPLTPGLRRQAVATGTVPTESSQATPTSSQIIRTVVTIFSVPTSTGSLTGPPGGNNQTETVGGSTSGSGSIDRNTAVFVIVILTVLAVVMLGILGLIYFFKRKSGKLAEPFKLTDLPGLVVSWLMPRRGRRTKDEKGKIVERDDDIAGAELGLPTRPLPPELEYGPAPGSTNNPAELDGGSLGQPAQIWPEVPRRPRRPPDPPDRELEYAIHRLSPVTELSESPESPYERNEERPMFHAKPRLLHIRNTSRSLTVPTPKPLQLFPESSARPRSSGLVSPMSPINRPESPIYGNQTRVYSNFRFPDEK